MEKKREALFWRFKGGQKGKKWVGPYLSLHSASRPMRHNMALKCKISRFSSALCLIGRVKGTSCPPSHAALTFMFSKKMRKANPATPPRGTDIHALSLWELAILGSCRSRFRDGWICCQSTNLISKGSLFLFIRLF